MYALNFLSFFSLKPNIYKTSVIIVHNNNIIPNGMNIMPSSSVTPHPLEEFVPNITPKPAKGINKYPLNIPRNDNNTVFNVFKLSASP